MNQSLADQIRKEMPTGVINADCVEVMRKLGPDCVDLIVTDPPYLVDYQSRDGRTVANDVDSAWVAPAFAEMYRILKPDSFCVSFYGWNRVEEFMTAWKRTGFRPVGHIVWQKDYASNRGAIRFRHEQAYVLAKGDPQPFEPIDDVLPWGAYTGNELHPTQKPVEAIAPLIKAFSGYSGIVLDPFCGSGTTLMAAKQANRQYLGIELVAEYAGTARERLQGRAEEDHGYIDIARPVHRIKEQDFKPSWSGPRRPWLPYPEYLARKRGMKRPYRSW